MTDTDDKTRKERSTILQLYAIFVASTIFSFAPDTTIQMIAFVLFFALILSVPIYQWRGEDGSLLKNHMIYLNRTIWIGSLFLFLSILLFGLWVYLQSDSRAFFELFMQVKNGFMITEQDIAQALREFLQVNYALLVQASILCLFPPMLYVCYRIGRGVARASQFYRMPNPRSWL